MSMTLSDHEGVQNNSNQELNKKNRGKNEKIFEIIASTISPKFNNIVSLIKNPDYRNLFNYFLLTGPQSDGLVLAQAIAHLLQRKLFFKEASSLKGDSHETIQNINDLFGEFRKMDPQPLFFLNGLDQLLQNDQDRSFIEQIVNIFLKTHEKDLDFLFIATYRDKNKISHKLQEMFLGKIIEVNHPNIQCRKDIIETYLTSYKNIDKNSMATFLQEFSEKTKKFSYQNLEQFVQEIVSEAALEKEDQDQKIIISKKHCQTAFMKIIQTVQQKSDDFESNLTDEERRHQEWLDQMKSQFEETRSLQIKLAQTNAAIHAKIAAACTELNGVRRPYTDHIEQISHDVFITYFPEYSIQEEPKPVKSGLACTIL